MEISIRRAVPEDEARLLGWANRPDALAAKRLTRGPISPDAHAGWFAARVAGRGGRIWIVECDGSPCGQVRLEGPIERPEIDVFVAEAYRQRGLATCAIRLVLAEQFKDVPDSRVGAVVRRSNAGSAALFASLGFREVAGDAEFKSFETTAEMARPNRRIR